MEMEIQVLNEILEKRPYLKLEDIQEKYQQMKKFESLLPIEPEFLISHLFLLIEKYNIIELTDEKIQELINNNEFVQDLDQILFNQLISLIVAKNQEKIKTIFSQAVEKEFEDIIECEDTKSVKEKIKKELNNIVEQGMSENLYQTTIPLEVIQNSELNEFLKKELTYGKNELILSKKKNGAILIK